MDSITDMLLEQKVPDNIKVLPIKDDDIVDRPPWLYGPLPLSRQGCKFQLPMDIKVLVDLTTVNYLTQYCTVSRRRKHLFKSVFTKADRDHDSVINGYELESALLDLYCRSITKIHLNDVLLLIDCQISNVYNSKEFSVIAAFSERYLCTCFAKRPEVNTKKEVLEETDFSGLKARLEGYQIAENLVKVLMSL